MTTRRNSSTDVLTVNEIFYSLQGEGFHTGTPAVFVRLSGCNLRCRFCDTDHVTGQAMTVEQIALTVNRLSAQAPLLVLTGGEPSLWIDNSFVTTLKSLTGKTIAIETNGTRHLPDAIDWVTLSPKSAFPGGDREPCVLTCCDELKVVFLGQDLAQYDHIEAKHRFLQPCFCTDDNERQRQLRLTIEAVMAHPAWRLSLQTHRLVGLP